MNTKQQALRRRSSAAIRAMGIMMVVWVLGVIYTPAVAASSSVTVDQQPLTVQQTIPPNIMLMLDDSGSMAWDYMPDWGYLTSSTGNGTPTNDQARNSAINGAYYNPTITYNPPPKADSTTATPDLYPASPGLTNAYRDGFTNSTSTDITKFTGGFPYYTRFKVTITSTYAATPTTTYSCPSGTTSDGNTPPSCYSCNTGYTLKTKSNGSFYCSPNSGGSSKTPNNSQYLTQTGSPYSCNGSDTLNGTTCTNSTQAYRYYFTYTTGSSNTEYYVAATGNCALLPTATPTAVSASLCKDDTATQQNVANWFSYYRTRIQMAKSGLMSAFSTVDKGFRVGFGSIDGGCNGDSSNVATSSSTFTYNDTYDCGNGGSVTNTLAAVQPFGDGSSSSDQKTAFWTWAAALSPNGGTPLRMALDEVGQYYQTSQPWETMSSDPDWGATNQPSHIACRQSYTILTTDGFWNENYSSTDSAALTATSNAKWPTIPGPNNQSWPVTAGSSPAQPYSGGITSGEGPSLADVALYYWENDLQNNTNFPNEVPTNSSDPAFWQHMVTFTMGLGFTPTGITPTSATEAQIFAWANGGSSISNFSWPTPTGTNNGSIYNIADLEHAGLNGHGGFYSATSPSTFTSGLTDALNRASSRVGSGASLAANSTQLTNGTVAYQAQYHTVQWNGDLLSLSINSSTGAISSTATWSASAQLLASATVASGVNTYPNRTIWTYKPGAAAAGTFVQFVNSGSGTSATPPALSSAELTALGGSSSTTQAGMVAYLRGDNTLEKVNNGSYRTRTTPLGDIVDSQPVYSGAPNPNEFENQSFTGISNSATSGNNSFQAFAVGTTSGTTTTPSAASTRTPLVFVAANDGMLHAFNASTGAETFAYLPGAVITAGSITKISDPNYGSTTSTTTPHQYFNDGELTIADVFFNNAWHTVLVGTTGRGLAKAVYALDITNPSSITPLWERSAADGMTNSNYIGQMIGKPVIAKVQDGTANSDWQVLIGNGYNSTAGTAALLEFNVATGALNVHTTDTSDANGLGLAAPVTWMDNPANGISMEAYAGDLAGQVWEFTLADTASSGTPPADFTAVGSLQFSAVDPSGTAQPITSGMLAGRDPITGYVWLFFGTGQYLTSSDTTNTQVQSWYGVIVQPATATTTGSGTAAVTMPALPITTADASMVQRYITYEQDGDPTASPPTVGERTVTTLPVPSDMPGKRGWYMNLEQPVGSTGAPTSFNKQGERMVTPNQFEGNLLLATTRIPQAAANADICNSSGSGWVMAVDPFTGTNPSGSFFMANGGTGTVTVNGKTLPVAGVGFSALPNNPIFVGGDMLMSFDNGSTSSLNTSGASGPPVRVSWKELVNP